MDNHSVSNYNRKGNHSVSNYNRVNDSNRVNDLHIATRIIFLATKCKTLTRE